eukprot:7362820-Prymnesium_polylepis.1
MHPPCLGWFVERALVRSCIVRVVSKGGLKVRSETQVSRALQSKFVLSCFCFARDLGPRCCVFRACPQGRGPRRPAMQRTPFPANEQRQGINKAWPLEGLRAT